MKRELNLKALLARLFPASPSPCGRGGVCRGMSECSDTLCEGHPINANTFLHLREPVSEPESDLKAPSIAVVTTATIAVALIALLCAVATVLLP